MQEPELLGAGTRLANVIHRDIGGGEKVRGTHTV